MARRRNKQEEQQVARQRVAGLLRLAAQEALRPDAASHALADRYAALALLLAQTYQVGLDRAAKQALCRKCGAFRVGGTSRTRVRGGRVVTTCLRCGAATRRPVHRARSAPTHATVSQRTRHPAS